MQAQAPFDAYTSGNLASVLIYFSIFVQVAFKNQKIKPAGERSVQEALDLLKDTYASAGERDIMTGDSVEFMVRHSAPPSPFCSPAFPVIFACDAHLVPLNLPFSLRSLPLLV